MTDYLVPYIPARIWIPFLAAGISCSGFCITLAAVACRP